MTRLVASRHVRGDHGASFDERILPPGDGETAYACGYGAAFLSDRGALIAITGYRVCAAEWDLFDASRETTRVQFVINDRHRRQMHIDIQANHLTLSEPLRKHIDFRLRMILARVGHRITRIIVRLSDVNGPKGGLDKVCKIEIQLSGMPEVVVEDLQSDMYLAFDRAVARAGRTLARRVALPATRRRSHAAGAAAESGWP